LNIHEYQAKEILRNFNVSTPRGYVAFNTEEAVKNAKKLDTKIWVVKAQIHAGGRGLGGGVKIAKSLDEVETLASQIIGMKLVTKQTSKDGQEVRKVYIEEGVDIKKEYYLSIVLDRTKEMPVIIASSEGGTSIEDIAESSPEKIIKVYIDPLIGFKSFHGAEVAYNLGLETNEAKNLIKFITSLYNVYSNMDAQMVEINPLVLTSNGDFIALDAKINFDDNALFRHNDVEILRDLSEEDESEIKASKYNLSYVKLDGNVGCMVNGAGLAMATMDIIKYEGGSPANFLDVGGNASAETVAKGFEIILEDKNVKSIFINIFGGIVRCDRVANGILEATKISKINVPIVVRLDGTNAKEAIEILNNSNISNIIAANDLADGAKKAVKAAQGVQ